LAALQKSSHKVSKNFFKKTSLTTPLTGWCLVDTKTN